MVSTAAVILLRIGESKLLSVTCAILVSLAINALIFLSPLPFDTTADDIGPISTFLGPLVAWLWVLWFVLIAVAFHVVSRGKPSLVASSKLVLVLFAACALYPVYTIGFSSAYIGLVANVAIAVFNTGLVVRLWHPCRRAALLLIPISAWLTTATVWVGFSLLGLRF